MRRLLTIAGAIAALGVAPAAAQAADPGTWVRTTALTYTDNYRQGLASNPATGDVFFAGPVHGVYKVRGTRQVAANDSAIPADVTQNEQYNHIGDIAFDSGEGGRLLLPLESYQAFAKDTNPSKTGSIGVMDATTLHWNYYVKLDPAEIPKAMMIATDPAAGLFWTPVGSDVLAYRLSDLSAANAAPAAAPIHSVKRLTGVVPKGTGGIAVLGGRIYFSSGADNVERVVSVDENTGASQTEIELPGNGEAEGLDFGGYLGGFLHWEVSTGLTAIQIYSFVPKGTRLSVRMNHARVSAKKKTTLTATVTALTNGVRIPLPGVQVKIGTRGAKTNAAGKAKVTVKLARGSYRAQAFFKGLRTATVKLRAT